MVGIALLIIIAIRIYKTAKRSGRNAILWTLAAIGIYLGIQIGVVLAIGIIIVAGQEFLGWEEDYFNKYILLINGISVVSSLLGILLLSNYAGKTPKSETFTEPPSPPKFDNI